MAIQPPEIDTFPPPPQRGNKETFADLFDAVITWFSVSVSKVGQACLSAYQNAVAAALSASSAEAAAEAATFAAGAVQWVSGTAYTKGGVVWSPTNGRTYRRLIAGAGTTDPASDRVNWVVLSSESALLATATVSTAVANIDFLNIFSADYDKYTIELQGLNTANGNGSVSFQLAIAQAVVASGYRISTPGNASGSGPSVFLTSSVSGAGPFSIEVRNANSAAGLCGIGVRGLASDGSGNLSPVVMEGVLTAPGIKTGIRVLTSGLFSAGTVRIFGHRNS